jgi:cell division protein FtsL
MTDLETQVVKIQLGDNRQATSFVFTLAETIEATETEIYVICELPMFNPAAKDECQRIAEAISAALRRSYRKTFRASIFENALATINEELAKLVTLGKTHWLGKLNAVVAVKHNNIFSVSSVGKISALLYRDGKFVSITEPSSSNQPLKTFEQFSEGKLRLSDMFILSTAQLFNHISIDRIKALLDKNELPLAAQSMIEHLQSEMGPEVACGTIFALQVEAGSITDEEVDLGQYLAGPPEISDSSEVPATKTSKLKSKVKAGAATSVLIAKNFAGDFKSKYIKPNYWRGLASRSGESVSVVQERFKKTTASLAPSKISSFSKQKKFFLISAAILLIALIANVVIVRMNKTDQQQTQTVNDQLTQIENKLNDSNAALLYGDEAQAASLLAEAEAIIDQLPEEFPEESQAQKASELESQAAELDNKLNKIEQADVSSLGTLGNSQHLIDLQNYLATEANRSIVSYNKTSEAIEENVLKSSESILDSIALNNNLAAIYNGSELFIWDIAGDIVTGRFSEGVPSENNFGGLKTYSTNNRVYLIDKSSGQVKSFATTGRSFGSPTISITDDVVKSASDLAIDGNIYILSGGTIHKFNSGAKQAFSPAITDFGDNGKLYTQVNYQNIYVLDPAKRRIVILGKDGSMVQTLTSEKFSEMRDFAIDESGRSIYVLNGSELLSVKF